MKTFFGNISVIFFAICFFFSFSGYSAEITAEEILKNKIQEIIRIIDDPSKKEAVLLIAGEMFDFEEISKRALAQKWETFSDGDREKFVNGFSQRILNFYYGKISGNAVGSEIIFLEQKELKKGFAEISTKIVRNGIETPVLYRMKLTDDKQWRVYDVVIEGICMVANYRAQLGSMSHDKIMAKIME